MASKAKKNSYSKTAIIVLPVLIIIGLAWAYRVSNWSKPSVAQPTTPSPSILLSQPTPRISSLPQPAGGAASQGAAAQATPVPGSPVESTSNGTEAGSPLHPTDTATTRCTWAAGTACFITFTSQDGKTFRQLSTQPLGSDGATSWVWTPGHADLTPGAWTVQAVGTSNGKQVFSNTEVVYVAS